MYPGIWRHGDWIEITERGTAIITGRSDATINRGGIRMGTAEIYRAVLAVDAIIDALVVDVPVEGADAWMPLFVVLREGAELTDDVVAEIRRRVREDCSPRHVPSDMIPVAEVPRTLSGKVLELPVKRILMGTPAEKAAARDSLANPEASTRSWTSLARLRSSSGVSPSIARAARNREGRAVTTASLRPHPQRPRTSQRWPRARPHARRGLGAASSSPPPTASSCTSRPAWPTPTTRGRSSRRSTRPSSAPASSPARSRPAWCCGATRWRSFSPLPLALWVLASTLLLATIIHDDRFKWDYAPTWVWTFVYAARPARDPGAGHAPAARTPSRAAGRPAPEAAADPERDLRRRRCSPARRALHRARSSWASTGCGR